MFSKGMMAITVPVVSNFEGGGRHCRVVLIEAPKEGGYHCREVSKLQRKGVVPL